MQGLQIPLLSPGLLVETDVLELEYHAQFLAVAAAEAFSALHIGAPGFAHGDQSFFAEGFPRHFLQEFVKPGTVGSDFLLRYLRNLIDHVQTETADALVHPEANHLVQFLPQSGIVPVQIRLLGCELMEIILLKMGHICPHGAAEDGAHIIGWAIGCAVPPEIIVMVWIVSTLQRFQKPGMLVGAVIQHQIHNDGDAPFVRFPDQGLHILHGAENGINRLIIGNIVTVVHLGRLADGGQPDSVDA